MKLQVIDVEGKVWLFDDVERIEALPDSWMTVYQKGHDEGHDIICDKVHCQEFIITQ